MERIESDKVEIERLKKKLDTMHQKVLILESMIETHSKELYMKNLLLEDQNKDLEQIVYIASHDLQEPLRTISNFTDLLRDKFKETMDDESKLYIDFVLSASSKMQNLIRDLLDISRVGKNSTFTQIDSNKIVKEVVALLDASIKESKAQIIFSDLPIIFGKETEIRQLFQNLISNAIKFRKKNLAPEIHITSEERENEFEFAIRDNGIGIEEKYFDRLFVLFQRLHSNDDYPGSGIGLATCRKIVTLHHGRIWVESKPGIGSTFYFTIQKSNKE